MQFMEEKQWKAEQNIKLLKELSRVSSLDSSYTPLIIYENIKSSMIERTIAKYPQMHNEINKFFNNLHLLPLQSILDILVQQLTTILQTNEGAVLLVNSGHVDGDGTYKSEDFLIFELLRRNALQDVPLYDIRDLPRAKSPRHCVLMDDACYSGGQWVKKLLELTSIKDVTFHVIIPFYTERCKNRLYMFSRSVRFYWGRQMKTASDVLGLDVDLDFIHYLTKKQEIEPDHHFENRESAQKYGLKPELLSMATPDYKIADEVSTFTHVFAELTKTTNLRLHEHYKKWPKIN